MVLFTKLSVVCVGIAKKLITAGKRKGGFMQTPMTLRAMVMDDIDSCASIVYEAFNGFANAHGFPGDIPSIDAARGLLTFQVQHPQIDGFVAENGKGVLGSIFLDHRDSVQALGMLTIDPAHQNNGVGRQLMQAAIDQSNAPSLRLLQEAYNSRSLALYSELGFNVKETLLLLLGRPQGQPVADVQVEPMRAEHIAACCELYRSVHGYDRENELHDAIKIFKPFVALRGGEVVAYTSAFAIWGHAVARSAEDLQALILGAGALSSEPLSLLLPIQYSDLLRWLLGTGFRIVKPFTLMVIGAYEPPQGMAFPSVMY
jgi:ribosomal protein S18 acetylase RimI-like enzyme